MHAAYRRAQDMRGPYKKNACSSLEVRLSWKPQGLTEESFISVVGVLSPRALAITPHAQEEDYDSPSREEFH